jgi:hypothetical protein
MSKLLVLCGGSEDNIEKVQSQKKNDTEKESFFDFGFYRSKRGLDPPILLIGKAPRVTAG